MTCHPPELYARFGSQDYLAQFYGPQVLVSEDERIVFRRLHRFLQEQGTMFPTAVDVGCGPCVHNALVLAPHCQAITLAEYVPANRDELRSWWDGRGHDWSPRGMEILFIEGGTPPDGLAVRQREDLLRSRLRDVVSVNLLRDPPLPGPQSDFDLVTSFFCSENVAATRDEWPAVFSRLLSLCAPGARVFLVLAHQCDGYRVGTTNYPTVFLDDSDVRSQLHQHGFHGNVEVVSVRGWEREGIERIMIASGSLS